MPELRLEAYLARVGHAGPLDPSRRTLVALHEAHVAAIPFENLDILLGLPIRLDLASLQAKLVDGRRGGYCFEQNTLFGSVVQALGFETASLAARVRAGSTALRPRTHMLLEVTLPEGPFLADVGFGADGPVHPLPLVAGPEAWLEGSGYRLRREGELWVLEGNLTGEWTDLYCFTREPQHPVDFEVANHFTSTHPDSNFVRSLTAQRSWPGRRVILRNRDLVVREARETRSQRVRDADHLLQVLDDHFGLSFPPGTRFAQPGF